MDGDWPNNKPLDPRFRPEWLTTDTGVPVARYVDKDFAKLEREKLWFHTWQAACRQEQIPEPGDYIVYEILDQSIFLVRQEDMSVKAFYNVCPHRATALAVGEGRFQLDTITCPFHGWKWNTKGENTFILDQPDFKHGCLQNKDVDLKEAQVALAFNEVFINLDPNGESFDEFMPAELREAFEAVYLQDMYWDWHKSFTLEANWKVAQEAFFEGYHVAQTHSQMIRRQIKPRPGLDMQKVASSRRLNFAISGWEQGHSIQGAINGEVRGLGRFPPAWMEGMSEAEQKELVIDFHTSTGSELQSMMLPEDIAVIRGIRNRPIPADSTVDLETQKLIREHYAAVGRKIGTPEAISRLGICHVFPNYTFLPLYGNVIIYRSRPTRDGNPDRCIFDVWSCKTYPEGEKPPKHVTENVTDPMDPAQMCMFLRQDYSNIPRQQIGLHSMAIEQTLLHHELEGMITTMHRALDRKLGG